MQLQRFGNFNQKWSVLLFETNHILLVYYRTTELNEHVLLAHSASAERSWYHSKCGPAIAAELSGRAAGRQVVVAGRFNYTSLAAAAAAARAVSCNRWPSQSQHVGIDPVCNRSVTVGSSYSSQPTSYILDDVIHRQVAPCCRPHSDTVVVDIVDSVLANRSSWLHFAGRRCRDNLSDESPRDRNSVWTFARRTVFHRWSDVDRSAGSSRWGLPRPAVCVVVRRSAAFHAANRTDGEMGRRACSPKTSACLPTTGTRPQRARADGPRASETQETGDLRRETAGRLSNSQHLCSSQRSETSYWIILMCCLVYKIQIYGFRCYGIKIFTLQTGRQWKCWFFKTG